MTHPKKEPRKRLRKRDDEIERTFITETVRGSVRVIVALAVWWVSRGSRI